MPDTPVHDYVAVIFTLPLTYLGEQSLGPNPGLLFGGAFLVASLLLSPDLDRAPHSLIAKRWGLLKHYWTPYGMLLSHRSKWSHSIRGTVLRMMYAFPLLLVPLIYFNVSLHPIIFGWILADTVHYILDQNFS